MVCVNGPDIDVLSSQEEPFLAVRTSDWKISFTNNGRLESCQDSDNRILHASGFLEMRFDKEGMRCVPGYDPLDLIGVILKPDIYTSGNRIRLAGLIIEADHQIASVLVAQGQSSSCNLLLSFGTFRINPAFLLAIYRFLGALDQRLKDVVRITHWWIASSISVLATCILFSMLINWIDSL